MSKAAHTEGEWVLAHDYERDQTHICVGEETIATVYSHIPAYEENAHVMKTAPKMLAALKRLAELQRKWRSDDESETIDSIEYMDEIDKILWTDIIAEAEGRKP